ncbi:hypothetical protein [Cerasicoccus fimbriatus]|uniref:hypothetical protein n=1 Tax=Cerasicoccus fimbriatus TaxID=3014554 RepID=UPI0022B41DFD|nr:hypothetical protein [Cerasicoccus sp. TK19100]
MVTLPIMRRLSLSIIIPLFLFAGLLPAQEQPRTRKPNTTIDEMLVDYGRSRERAEEAVLDQAKNKAFDGDYILDWIKLENRGDTHFCRIKIKHDIYRPNNRRPLQEVTVGYGRTIQLAEIDARYKAERMINDRLNSAKERRKRQEALEAAKQRESAALGNDPVILDKDDDNSYVLKSIHFEGGTDDYICYIRFEYLIMK